ncbi:hypothetical protein Tco_0640295 [Tanacetum coccineum]
MSIDNNKPSDPLVDDSSILTFMTSSQDVCFGVVNDSNVKVVKGGLRKAHRGCKNKVSTPGLASAGAGSLLKWLCSSKMSGKAHVRAESSPSDFRGGKRVVTTPKNDVLKKVLFDVCSGLINNFKFDMGNSDDCIVNCSLNKDNESYGLSPMNDGSFIKDSLCPTNDYVINSNSRSPVAIGCDPKDSVEHVGSIDVGNASHVLPILVDSTAPAMIGMDFEFGKVDSSKVILNKPLGSLLIAQFGSNIPNNPFVRKSVSNSSNENWNSDEGIGFGSKIMSNQYSAVADSFAEKLKKGSEELVLKMEYMSGSVS